VPEYITTFVKRENEVGRKNAEVAVKGAALGTK